MAIQVNGTTVIDNSRNLTNVGGLKTVGGSSILGSGNISTGASTTLGGVGTYTLAQDGSTTTAGYGFKSGRTTAGSNLTGYAAVAGQGYVETTATSTSFSAVLTAQINNNYVSGGQINDNTGYSGSWRAMSPGGTRQVSASGSWDHRFITLWVRYS